MKNQYFVPVYRNLLFRLLAALGASVFIVKYGKPVSIFKALIMPSFYIATGASFIIAFLLINWVHLFTVLLDRWASWRENKLYRAGLQVLLCLLIPAILAYLMATLYFHLRGVDIEQTDYESLEFPVIIIMLCLLNIYYYYTYELKRLRVYARMISKVFEITKEKEIKDTGTSIAPENNKSDEVLVSSNESKYNITIRFNTHHFEINVMTRVACFLKASDGYWVKMIEDGQYYPYDKTLKEAEALYGGYQFFRLNRNALINRKAITGYHQGTPKGTLIIELLPGIQDTFRSINNEEVTVYKNKTSDFIEWYIKTEA